MPNHSIHHPNEPLAKQGDADRMRSRRIFINIVGWILGGVTGTVAMMLVAKYSGSITLGIFAYAIAFFNTFAFPSALDVETAHLRILPSRNDDEAKARAIGAYGVIRVALSLIAMATLLIAVGLGFSDTIENEDPHLGAGNSSCPALNRRASR
jgi:O-antigen/teichoic acid export membrane protein